MHERVHNPKASYSSSSKKCYTSVSVYNDKNEYNLYGITDCIEINNKNSDLCIVEYKPTKPKNKDYNFDDLIQVFAQKICVDYIFNSDCDGVIYYADVKKRIKLPLKENFTEYDEFLKKTLNEMRDFLSEGKIPEIQKNQNCSGCSMKDICMPALKAPVNVRRCIAKILEKKE
jgi:CRISPR-associated exonuclease Cas4